MATVTFSTDCPGAALSSTRLLQDIEKLTTLQLEYLYRYEANTVWSFLPDSCIIIYPRNGDVKIINGKGTNIVPKWHSVGELNI